MSRRFSGAHATADRRTPRSTAVLSVALWLVAALAVLVLPFVLYRGLTDHIESLNARIDVAAQADLAPLVRQQSIPRELVAAAADFLERDRLAVNYLTLRNNAGVILLSDGRFESLASFLPFAQARQLRGWLYRTSSDDRRLRLTAEGAAVGYMDYGIDLQRAVTGLSPSYWAVLLLWAAALLFMVVRYAPMRGDLARLREPPPEGGRDLPHPHPGPAQPDAAASAPEEWPRLADALGLGVVVTDALGRVRQVNDPAAEMLGRSADVLQGRRLDEIVRFSAADGRRLDSPVARCLQGTDGPLRSLLRTETATIGMVAGQVEQGRVHAVCWPVDSGQEPAPEPPAGIETVAGKALWSEGDQGVAVIDGNGLILAVNPAWCRVAACDESALVGVPLRDFLPEFEGDDSGQSGLLGGADTARVAYRVAPLEIGGGLAGRLVTMRLLAPASGSQPAAGGVATDSHDPLTGLAVRQVLTDRLEQAWPRGDVDPDCLLVVIDIADFAQYNRSLGREAGDAMLAEFAARLQAAWPKADCAARLGGDEFAMLQSVAGGEGEAGKLVQQLHDVFGESLRRGGWESLLQVNMGWALGAEDADSPQALMERAEIALAAVEAAGDYAPRRYSPDMSRVATAKGPAAQNLRRALARGELRLRLWPVWLGAFEEAGLAAAWAQCEWCASDGESFTGQTLFAHAEEIGLVGELGAWCLRESAEIYTDWRNIGLSAVPLLLPLSAAAAAAPVSQDAWRITAHRYGVPEGALILVSDAPGAVPIQGLRSAAECGADDSPAADVLWLAPDILRGLAQDDDQAKAAARAVADLGRETGKPVIGGPVEEDSQLQALSAAGIEYWFPGGDDDLVAPRALGRLLAKRGGTPL